MANVSLAAPVLLDEQLPVVSRDRLTISTVRRGDLVRHVEANGTLRRTDAFVEAVFPVNAGDAQELMVGQPALITTGRGLHQGTVSRMQQAPDSRVIVSVSVVNTAAAVAGLRGGETVAGLIETEELNGVLLVGGVTATAPGGTVSWFKLDPDCEHASRVQVGIGKTGTQQAEIWSGLSEGDRVITQGINLPPHVNRVLVR